MQWIWLLVGCVNELNWLFPQLHGISSGWRGRGRGLSEGVENEEEEEAEERTESGEGASSTSKDTQ